MLYIPYELVEVVGTILEVVVTVVTDVVGTMVVVVVVTDVVVVKLQPIRVNTIANIANNSEIFFFIFSSIDGIFNTNPLVLECVADSMNLESDIYARAGSNSISMGSTLR